MRNSADITPVVPTTNVVGAAPVGAKVTVPPVNAVLLSAVYCTSMPTSRLLVGFHKVRDPICQAAQSAHPGPNLLGAQTSVSTAELSAR